MTLYQQLIKQSQSRFFLKIKRFSKTEKKKYNLGESSNLHQLKADQIHQLNLILFNMKTEYDNLMREIILKKQETERFGVTM